MWKAAIVILSMAGCAQSAPSNKNDLSSVDLASANPAPDLTGLGAVDLRSPLPGADMATGPLDLLTVQQDLSGADLAGPPNPLINEVAPAAGGNELNEYIELLGGDTDINLFGWALWYQPDGIALPTQLLSFPLISKLPARHYILITAQGSSYANIADYTYPSGVNGTLPASGGAVALQQALTVIDSVGWGAAKGNYVKGSAAPAPDTQGDSRIPDGTNSGRNSADFQVAPLTPRMANHL